MRNCSRQVVTFVSYMTTWDDDLGKSKVVANLDFQDKNFYCQGQCNAS